MLAHTPMNTAPPEPATARAASVNGAACANASRSPSIICATYWIATYSTVIADIAMKSARGTVRAGSFTSPPGTSANSIPAKAKINTITDLPSLAGLRLPNTSGRGPCASIAPRIMKRINGNNFTTVIISRKRVLCLVPRTLSAPNNANTTARINARGTGSANGGQNTAIDPTSALPTAAVAVVPTSHNSVPARNPTYLPRAISTYAYGPPVRSTLLPACAKQSTMSPIAAATTMYAIGADGPIVAATTAGSTKIPPPTVTLNAVAARPRTPIARSSPCSLPGFVLAVRNVVIPPKVGIQRSHPAEGRDPAQSSRRRSGSSAVIPPKVGIQRSHPAEGRDPAQSSRRRSGSMFCVLTSDRHVGG